MVDEANLRMAECRARIWSFGAEWQWRKASLAFGALGSRERRGGGKS